MMIKGYIHTLGDSTLDNIYWVEPAQSVEAVLQTKVNDLGYQVVSHAYDGFTTQSVLQGDIAGRVLRMSQNYLKKKMPVATSYQVSPLKELKESIEKAPNVPHFVVLSVGGNDFRENLLKPWSFLGDIPQIRARYLNIVERVKKLGAKPILMFQYRTDANQDPYRIYTLLTVIGGAAIALQLASLALATIPLWRSRSKASIVASVVGLAGLYFTRKLMPFSATRDVLLRRRKIGVSTLGSLMELFYRPILTKIGTDIPVLDLPNTFNPFAKLYVSGIEPGAAGSELIATGISRLIRNHDFSKKSERLALYTIKTTQELSSPSSWTVGYPKS